MKVVRTVEELDQQLAACDAAERVSDDAMRAMFGTFRMEPPPGNGQLDPFSPAYRAAQMALYRAIAGVDYSTDREVTRFDIEAAVARPFPFATGSSATAGEYFMAIGFVLKTMALPPNSRVLEFGPGWGFTSLWLAQLGHHVTVVDIEPCFCELIRRRAAREGVSIEVVDGDFFWIESRNRQFDAVLFYDCFHHCDDHLRLLRALTEVVAPEGRVFFGAEPIVRDFPVPWGLRLDGWSLWGVRKHGWMELGFRDDYFAAALRATGWFGRRIAVGETDRLRVWEARHLASARLRFAADDLRLQTVVGMRRDGRLVVERAAAGTALYGPYVDLPAGSFAARIVFVNPIVGHAEMDVATDAGRRQFPRVPVQGTEGRLEFTLAEDARGVEVRLFCAAGVSATLDYVEFIPLGL